MSSHRVSSSAVANISIGRDCYINCGVFLDSSAHISIGARTSLGPLVAILTGTHDIGGPE